MKLAAVVIALGFAACGNHDRDQPASQTQESERHPRVVDPPAKEVHALPPHAIRADGVGPYKVGASLAELNDLVRSGPHIAQIEISNVVRASVLRAEDDGILIGGEPQGRATFVAVVGAQVARTESGIHVGSTRAELVQALGAPEVDPDRARDPRIVVPSGMPELRAVMKDDRVVGLVVAARVAPAHEDGSAGSAAAPGAFVTVDGDEVTVHATDDKVIWSHRFPGAGFAALIGGELYVVTHADDSAARTWSIAAFRLEGARFVPAIDATPVYTLTAANARWLGAELRDVDLMLELASRPDGVEVGGLLATRAGDKLRDLLVLAPVPIQIAQKRPKPPVIEAGAAGTPDANPTGSAGGSAAGSASP